MKQLEKNADAFGFFTKPITQIQETPFKKLAFFGASIGVGITLTLGIGIISNNAYQESIKEEQIQLKLKAEKQQKAEEILAQSIKDANARFLTQIKKITPAEFQNFISYIEKQQNFYDSRAKLISNSLIEAQIEDRQHSLDGLKESKNIEGLVATHKESYDNFILNFYKTYKAVHNMGVSDTASMKILLDHYTSYEAGIAKRNLSIEKQFHSYIYAKNQGNVDYNLKHKVSVQMQELENENLSILKSTKLKL